MFKYFLDISSAEFVLWNKELSPTCHCCCTNFDLSNWNWNSKTVETDFQLKPRWDETTHDDTFVSDVEIGWCPLVVSPLADYFVIKIRVICEKQVSPNYDHRSSSLIAPHPSKLKTESRFRMCRNRPWISFPIKSWSISLIGSCPVCCFSVANQ